MKEFALKLEKWILSIIALDWAKLLLVLFALFLGLTVSAEDAKADDPRVGRMVTLLERMDERIGRLESRVAIGSGSYRQSIPSPASYRQFDDQYQTYFRQGWNAGLRDMGLQPVSTRGGVPIRFASYEPESDYSVPVNYGSYGGGQVITIRLVIVGPGSEY